MNDLEKYIIINLKENDILDLSTNDDLYNLMKIMKKSDPSLPFELSNRSIVFKDYFIGNIKIDNYIINIDPRIDYLDLNHYMEMFLYVQGISLDYSQSLYGNNSFYGFQKNLVSNFLDLLTSITESGLEGNFSEYLDYGRLVKGRIDLNHFNYIKYYQNELPYFSPIHTVQSTHNALLKKALTKLACHDFSLEKDMELKISKIKSYFTDIDTSIYTDQELCMLDHSNIPFINKDYHAALELAKKIILDFKIKYQEKEEIGSSFFMNSNNLFEEYTRKILSNNLENNVQKWNNPKVFAKLNTDQIRSYSPDILINYDSRENVSLSVLDAKHKNVRNIDNIADVSDLYQLIFYCNQLKSNKGGLIYPINSNQKPILVNTLNESNITLYCFFVNFELNIKERHLQLINDIKKSLHI